MIVMISSQAFAAEKNNWVLLTVADHSGSRDYYGVVSRDLIRQIENGTFDKPFMSLDKPFFYDGSMNIKVLSESNEKGVRYGLTGPMLIRVDTIVRVFDIDDDLTEARMEEHRLITSKPTPARR
jgi:hypothetical protein